MLNVLIKSAGAVWLAIVLSVALLPPTFAQPIPGASGGETTEEEKKPTIELDEERVKETQTFMENWEKRVNNALEKYGLSGTVVGKSVATAGIFLLALALWLLARRLLRRVARYIIGMGQRFHFQVPRLHLYRRGVLTFITLALLVLLTVATITIWSPDSISGGFVKGLTILLSVLSNVFSFLLVAIVIFEGVSAALEHYFARLGKRSGARVNTLLPIARNVIYGGLFVVFTITLISELGINVMPLLAGAGVIGFAIGFGAQTLMKDLITGFIIIIEDLIQVGDIASVGGKTGAIERITIRKVQLRDLSGIVYTVPFSEIGIVENLTKHFSYYLLEIGVAYRESPDEVIELSRNILQEMLEDENYKNSILEPLDVLGLDSFGDSAIIIKARIKTRPGKQWEVGREFNRRMKYVFDENNIEIPFPHTTLYFGEDKEGKAPPANLRIARSNQPANDPSSGDTEENHNNSPVEVKAGHDNVDNDD